MVRLIAFGGKMGSGKTTCAKHVLDKYCYTLPKSLGIVAKHFKFADPIYDIAHNVFAMDPNKKNRALLIDIGSKLREIDDNVFVTAMGKKLKDSMQEINKAMNERGQYDAMYHYDTIVIDDVRFPHELELLRNWGFVTIYLDALDHQRHARLVKEYGQTRADQMIQFAQDSSETSLDQQAKFDFVIKPRDMDNLESMFRAIDQIVDSYDRLHVTKPLKQR